MSTEHFRTHLELQEHNRQEKQFALQPFLKTAETNYLAAIKFAEHVIRAGLLLNGGALVAIPALAAFIGVKSGNTPRSLKWAMVAFVIGLACAWLTAMLGFLATRDAEQSHQAAYDGTRINCEVAYGEKKETPELKEEFEKKRSRSTFLWERSQRIFGICIAAAVLSFVAFVLGAVAAFQGLNA